MHPVEPARVTVNGISAFAEALSIVNMREGQGAESFEEYELKTVGRQMDLRWKRSEALNKHGDRDHALGWSLLPDVKRWQQTRCA